MSQNQTTQRWGSNAIWSVNIIGNNYELLAHENLYMNTRKF